MKIKLYTTNYSNKYMNQNHEQTQAKDPNKLYPTLMDVMSLYILC